MRHAHRLIVGAALLGCVAWAGGCQRKAEPRSVLLVVVDTLRADALGVYGANHGATPNLDSLAQRALLFRRAYAVSSWTHPSVASLLTGQPPATFQPGAQRYVPEDRPTLAEVFRAHGYRTAAFVANPMMAPELGFGRGFESYRGYGPWVSGLAPLENKTKAAEVADEAIAWLQEHGSSGSWFLYVHFMDPHWPYEPELSRLRPFWKGDLPPPEAIAAINQQVRAREATPPIVALARSLYFASVSQVDAEIGRLLRVLEARGLAPRTVVVVTADHGEEFGDHSGVLHARTLYEEVLRVPLLVGVPGRGPAVVEEPVSLLSLASTLAEAAGISPVPFPGPALWRSPGGGNVPVQAQLFPFPPAIHRRAVIEGSQKLILPVGGAPELYDVVRDPREKDNRAAEHPALVQRLGSTPSLTGSSHVPAVDDAHRERMRALGYDF